MDSRQFVAGSVAGCVGQIVGHPLDSIKVMMQTQTAPPSSSSSTASISAVRTALTMYHSQYGVRSFFRGLSLPLLTKSFEQSIAFGLKGTIATVLEEQQYTHLACLQKLDESLKAGLSGSMAGACTSLLLTPVYLVKVQLQATTTAVGSAAAATIPFAATHSVTSSSVGSLSGPVAAIQTTVARVGWRGLYTGCLPTFLGTSIGYGFRFATYDKTVRYIEQHFENNDQTTTSNTTNTDTDTNDTTNRNNHTTQRQRKLWSCILGGGLAGMATYLSHYPLDLVANRMMANVVLLQQQTTTSTTTTKALPGMRETFRTIYHHQGWTGYFRGLGPCLLRAFPANAAIFVSYEFCMGTI